MAEEVDAVGNLKPRGDTGAEGLGSSIPGITDPFAAFSQLNDEIARGLNAVADVFKRRPRLIEEIAQALAKVAAATLGQMALVKLVDAAGWLPHVTTPYDRLDGFEALGSEGISDVLAAYYRDHWPEVRSVLQQRLDSYDLDEARFKAPIREALVCHEAGLYRATVRTIFPTLEDLGREFFHGGRLKVPAQPLPVAPMRGKQGRARLPVPFKVAFRDGWQDAPLFERLEKHLYARVETPEQLSRFLADPIPNRHAALHGLIDYNTAQNSLNALIMADYVCGLMVAIQASRAAAATPFKSSV